MNIEFLTATHKRSTGQPYYAIIDRKHGDSFSEQTTIPDEVNGHDVFWTPLTFIGQRHNKQATGLNILFADLDHKDADLLHQCWPHLLWETSSDSTQAVWFLTHDLDLATWSELNQRMTYFMQADKGGWHASKLLRIPGTLNYKTDPPDRGQPLSFQPEADEYMPEELDQLLPPIRRSDAVIGDLPPTLTHLEWEDHLRSIWDRLELGIRTNLMQATQHDRSQATVYVTNRMLATGFSREEIYFAIQGTQWNKFLDRPALLWQIVSN